MNLKKLYKISTYSIVNQQIQRPFKETEWYDFLELIKLGHYELSDEEITMAVQFYNERSSKKIKNLSDIEPQIGEVVRRLTERLTHIKPMNIDNKNHNIL